MKIATYTRFGESARRLGMVRGDQIIDLEDNGIDGNMMSVITGGVDTAAIDAALAAGDFSVSDADKALATMRADDYREDDDELAVAGAGGAAHLPGMVASLTPLPVIGVPIKSSNSIDGWDSVLSILQMPNGVPVATVALDAAKNAGILAAQIIGSSNAEVLQRIVDFKEQLKVKVMESVEEMKKNK